jgi:hypothetical protein
VRFACGRAYRGKHDGAGGRRYHAAAARRYQRICEFADRQSALEERPAQRGSPWFTLGTLRMSVPSKRTVLPHLTVKRLSSLCDAFEVDRAGLTRKDDLVDALVRARRVGLEELLAKLPRKEL